MEYYCISCCSGILLHALYVFVSSIIQYFNFCVIFCLSTLVKNLDDKVKDWHFDEEATPATSHSFRAQFLRQETVKMIRASVRMTTVGVCLILTFWDHFIYK